MSNVENTTLDGRKPRVPRKKATIEDHIAKYDKLFVLLDSEIERKSKEKERGIRTLRKVRKTLKILRKEIPQVTKSRIAKQYASTRKSGKSGLNIEYNISEEMRVFLKLDKNQKISRNDAFRAICVYINLKDGETREQMLKWEYLNPGGKRNLQNKHDHKAIIPDKALSKLLNYEKYKKDVKKGKIVINTTDPTSKVKSKKVVTSDFLYYYVLQKLITPHFITKL